MRRGQTVLLRMDGFALAANPSGAAALVWTDDRIGNNGIYIQNVNPNCTLGIPE